jgi:hypothetical protein
MSHFKIVGEVPSTVQTEKLFISTSPDGLNWTALNNGNPVWEPPNWQPFFNVVRDPSIIYANGFFWVAYTSGNYGYHAKFAVVRSADLLNWTHVTDVSTLLPDAYAPFTWGPFFFQDTDGSVHVFVSIGERFDRDTGQPIFKLRSYEVHPLNQDFTQWSAPMMVQAPSTQMNEFWVWREGDKYHAVYVDFLDNGAYVHVTSDNLITGWTNRVRLGMDSLEGCFVLKKPGGGYRAYVEGQPNYGYRYFDFNESFQDRQPPVQVNSSMKMRNGKVVAAPTGTTFANWQQTELAAVPEEDRGPLADPDLDGVKNLAECSMGLSPRVPNLSPVVHWRDTNGKWRARHYRLPGLSDVALALETSPTLIPWEASSASMSLSSRTLMSDGRQLLEWAETAPVSERLLLRLNATLSPP